MTKRKLRGYVLPTIYVIMIGILCVSVFLVSESLNNYQPDNQISQDQLTKESEKTQTVVGEKIVKVSKPYTDESVSISKTYYEKDAEPSLQENSLIYYENTYMPNTGILYGSDNPFDVVCVLDGTVKDIKQDEILGTVIFVEHENNYTTMYYSLGETKVEKGAIVNQNTVLGVSGKNGLENEKEYSLLFEVSKDGILINPENFYNLSSEELLN